MQSLRLGYRSDSTIQTAVEFVQLVSQILQCLRAASTFASGYVTNLRLREQLGLYELHQKHNYLTIV
jgi:hypothetical protein